MRTPIRWFIHQMPVTAQSGLVLREKGTRRVSPTEVADTLGLA